MSEQISIPRDHLREAMKLLPKDKQSEFLNILLLGPQDANVLPSTTPKSYPLTTAQAKLLRDKIDVLTWEILKKAVTNSHNGVAKIDWLEIKKLTSTNVWSVFAQGRLSGLNRSLRKIVNDPQALLFFWDDNEWIENTDEGDYSAGTLCIDGPAIEAIRQIKA